MPTGKGPLRIAFEDFLADSPLALAVKGIFTLVTEFVEGEARSAFIDELTGVINDLDIPPHARSIILGALQAKKPAAILAILGAGLGIGLSMAQSFLHPVSVLMSYQLAPYIKQARFDPSSVIKLLQRGENLPFDIRNDLVQQGWGKDRIKLLEELFQPRHTEGDLIRLMRREPHLSPEVMQEIKNKGWSDRDTYLLLEMTKQYPGAQDLIRFMIRDVYNEGIVNRFGFREDMPELFLHEMEKLGYAREDAERYYMSAWETSPPQMMYQMLHRLRPGKSGNPFTEADLELGLKSADYPPPVRQWLKEISYETFTRVDVRRMFELGVLDETGVLDAYLDLGYSPDNAKKLTEFTVLDVKGTDKNLTREALVSGYVLGIASRSEAKDGLIGIGYDEFEAEYWLLLEDAKQRNKLVTEELSITEFSYVEGTIDRVTASNEMDSLGVPAERKENLLQEWDVKRRKKIKRLTKSELEDMYKRDLIGLDVIGIEIEKLGYSPENAQRVIKLIDMQVSEDKQRDLLASQKEKERIDASATATTYQKAKSALDVQIAEFRVDIADYKLAINQTDDDDLKMELKAELDKIPLAIAELNLQKARVRQTATG